MVNETQPPAALSRTNSLGVWGIRLLLAVLLLFGSEILLWVEPLERSITDWILLVAGYVALSAVLLDLAARYGIRNIYDMMTLSVLYALAAGVILNPQIALDNFPANYLTYVMGAQSLLGLEMLGLFLFLTGGTNRRAGRLILGYSLWVGFYWGIWVRWSPSQSDWLVDEVTLSTMFTVAGGILAVCVLMMAVTYQQARELSPRAMWLSPNVQRIVAGILAGLFLLRLSKGQTDAAMVILSVGLAILCMSILWVQRPTKGAILLDAHVPPRLPSGWLLLLAIATFVAATVMAYNLSLIDIEGYSQLTLMQVGFSAVGLTFLPIIAAVVGVQGMDRLTRFNRF